MDYHQELVWGIFFERMLQFAAFIIWVYLVEFLLIKLPENEITQIIEPLFLEKKEKQKPELNISRFVFRKQS